MAALAVLIYSLHVSPLDGVFILVMDFRKALNTSSIKGHHLRYDKNSL